MTSLQHAQHVLCRCGFVLEIASVHFRPAFEQVLRHLYG
jgi:hypothetical protein